MVRSQQRTVKYTRLDRDVMSIYFFDENIVGYIQLSSN